MKFDTSTFTAVGEKSLPSWERGLKCDQLALAFRDETVAPLVGAWIEISLSGSFINPLESLPSWERGLKFFLGAGVRLVGVSLPSWERGLKLYPHADSR